MSTEDLKELQHHFAFGENWADYARSIDALRLQEAVKGLLKLAEAADWQGRSVLDLGCGSGLHSLAALQLGVAAVHAIDIDPKSVATTRALLSEHQAEGPWRCETASVFALPAACQQAYDIVYSWGVLHHTGAMMGALRLAAQGVKPGGLFIFALYRKTRLCALWRLEKRWYSQASARAQARARRLYMGLAGWRLALRGDRLERFKEHYQSSRGMNFEHDVHDWLGGYPYESISPPQVEALMQKLGFEQVRRFVRPGSWGWGGSGCDEYVYRRRRSAA